MAMNFPAAGASSSIGFSFSRLGGVPFVLNAKLNALETNGNGRILSAPKILTLDNKKAMIKQGLEYPYLERDDAGGSSVSFKDIDLLLEVTPHVTPDDRISMSIFITKNDVASLTAGVPSISTNEAQTELLVNDGDTLVIGGIIKATQTEGQSGFPMLSRIPLLGWMFKTHNERDENNELLIFITPRIVQLEQKELAF
jgi:type IV pilus assembly protein PilQ